MGGATLLLKMVFDKGGRSVNSDTVAALLHRHQFRVTQEREALLQVFTRTARLMTPKDLHALVVDVDERVGLTTVYRFLEALTTVGLAVSFLLEGETHFVFCSSTHHHHFICIRCKGVQDIAECPGLPSCADYGTVLDHKVDLFGLCRLCEGGGKAC